MIQFGLLLAAIRLFMAFGVFTIEGHLLAGYTAIAHVYMGVLLCHWWHNRARWAPRHSRLATVRNWFTVAWWDSQPWQWYFLWFMNAVEVFSFAISRI
jgi:hypothetical protein